MAEPKARSSRIHSGITHNVNYTRDAFWHVEMKINHSYYRVSYHGMKVAAHLQQTLQGLHHLLLAERVESGVIGGFAAFQLSYCGFQSH